jgi:hypothetical protein
MIEKICSSLECESFLNTLSNLQRPPGSGFIPHFMAKRDEGHKMRNRNWGDRIYGLVSRVPGYRSRGQGSIPGAIRFPRSSVGLERGPLSLVSTTEEHLKEKVAAPV